MKTRIVFFVILLMFIFVIFSCFSSELSWSAKENGSDSVRQVVGLPSIAIGNLNPSARNPGLEFFCTSLYDTPGGFCSYFVPGIPPYNFKVYENITLGATK